MTDIAIRCNRLGKLYRIGERERYKALRDTLTDALCAPARHLRSVLNGSAKERSVTGNGDNTFWALKDVSFEVKHGEVVGIVGRNGAGKSTLLKILSRITKPTEGRVRINGRVSSLLEVGTGFHPELTGRENIFLNGAILGMKRAEIQRKFDEIVAFAEIEKFIDTPVKRYSSGMYVRLAFAVAAHLEPEVLVVDEVLAVGDIAFQRKCLNKMQDVGRQGRTVLFVSHNMPAITRLCDRAILLSEGAVAKDGPVTQVVNSYLHSDLKTFAEREWPNPDTAPKNDIVRLRRARICTEEGQTAEAIDIRRKVGIEIEYDVMRAGHVLTPNYHFYNEEGICVFVLHDLDPDWRYRPRPAGQYASTAWIPGNLLAEGSLLVGVAISTYHPAFVIHLYERDAVAFQVFDSLDGDTARGDFAGHVPGVVRPLVNWSTRYISV